MRNITRKEVRRWTELGARSGVVGEVRGHYRSNRSTGLTWCYNRNILIRTHSYIPHDWNLVHYLHPTIIQITE